MKGYGQYCPLALAAELLCQRWTVLVISRVIDGCSRFNEIHQGVPLISPSMLSRRLSELEDAGIIERQKLTKGYAYHPTKAGRSLAGIIDAMAIWGQQWARDNTLEDLDISFLAWSVHLRVDKTAFPSGRTVVEFDFTGAPKDSWRFWLVNTHDEVEMCLKHPGYETDLLVTADLREFVETWRGFRDLATEIRERRIKLSGPRNLTEAFSRWLLLSTLAPYERRREGREHRLWTESHERADIRPQAVAV